MKEKNLEALTPAYFLLNVIYDKNAATEDF